MIKGSVITIAVRGPVFRKNGGIILEAYKLEHLCKS